MIICYSQQSHLCTEALPGLRTELGCALHLGQRFAPWAEISPLAEQQEPPEQAVRVLCVCSGGGN